MDKRVDQKDILVLLVATTLGSAVRVLRETQIKKLSLFKIVYIVLCGFFISYLIHGILKERGWFIYYGQVCALSGIIAIDVVEALIKRLPEIIINKIDRGL